MVKPETTLEQEEELLQEVSKYPCLRDKKDGERA